MDVCAGGNTDLTGFKTRVARDLCELLPEYSTVLNVQMCPGSSSWSVAMGSTYVTMPCSGKQDTSEAHTQELTQEAPTSHYFFCTFYRPTQPNSWQSVLAVSWGVYFVWLWFVWWGHVMEQHVDNHQTDWSDGNAFDFHMQDAWFKSCLGYWISWQISFVVFLKCQDNV